MDTEKPTSRRRFLCLTGGLAAGALLPAIPSTLRAAPAEARVSPMEDLMREHGVLRRVLLIYEEASIHLGRKIELPSGVIEDSALIMRRFIHDYHERLEEEEIFPRLQNNEKLNGLIAILVAQHKAGRRLTDSILKWSKPETVKAAEVKTEQQKQPAAVEQIYGGTPFITHMLGKDTPEMRMTREGIPQNNQGLLDAMDKFVRMYRPHAAREDTVLFTAFHSVVTPRELTRLSGKFEDRERELFGEQGFEKMVESVAGLEKALGIYDLSKFTPAT